RASDVFAVTVDNNSFLSGALFDNGGPVETVALRRVDDNPALDSGDDAPDTTNPPETTAAAGGDTDTTDAGDSTESSDSATTEAPTTSAIPTTTVAPLADLPDCPTEALDAADGPIEIVFWHGMTNELETALVALTDDYNASQDQVVVQLQNQTSYDNVADNYISVSGNSRPVLVQLEESRLRSFADSGTVVPAGACLESSGFDTSAFVPRTLTAYQYEGIQWSMPFNVSNPILYYNRSIFEAAGLDPDDPPVSLDEVRAASQAIVDSGAASVGLVLDSGPGSGGGWFLEQWFGRVDEPYADNGNGRIAPATEVLFNSELGVELTTFLQGMINDGLAMTVGDNPGGQDSFLKLADQTAPGAMTIGTSAALGTVIATLGGGLIPGLTAEDFGTGPMPGPGDEPQVQVGGASLWIADGKSDEETAAAWDYITFLLQAESQSQWAAATGYVPVRTDALDLDPLATTYAEDPRFEVAFDQLISGGDDDLANAPVLGPQREVRGETSRAIAAIFNGEDPQTALDAAKQAADALIASYNERN
ncbi:MAG: ABC transporter substrate-binding protein, partial [Actinomycetota bacterium]